MSAKGRKQTLSLLIQAKKHEGQLTARSRHSTQTKTAPEGAAYDDLLIRCYAFFRLATPIRPIRPEPNNQAAAGTGTAETSHTAYDILVKL